MRVAFCVPSLQGPTTSLVASLERSVPFLDQAGIEHATVEERGCPYISHARATMLRKALDWGADAAVFLDYDLSWDPDDLVTLVQTVGDVVAGLYRYKTEPEQYMGVLRTLDDGQQLVRQTDGALLADKVPAGFLKVTAKAVERFMSAYPELIYGVAYKPSIDLFNHGAIQGVWHGEDMAFSRRWRELGEQIFVPPNLSLTHHSADQAYPGNYLDFLLRQPGGAREGEPPWWELDPNLPIALKERQPQETP